MPADAGFIVSGGLHVLKTEAPGHPDLRALQRLAHDTASHGSL